MKKEVCIAVDYGGTKMMIAAVEKDGNILVSHTYKTGYRELKYASNAVISCFDDFYVNKISNLMSVVCIGMGLVGQINYRNGIWEKLYGLPNDNAIPISSLISGRYQIPCTVDNDVKVSMAAERKYGTSKGSSNFVYINIGTGISAGVVCDGHILRGKKQQCW